MLSVGFYRISNDELVDTLNKQLDVISEALGSYLRNYAKMVLTMKLIDS